MGVFLEFLLQILYFGVSDRPEETKLPVKTVFTPTFLIKADLSDLQQHMQIFPVQVS